MNRKGVFLPITPRSHGAELSSGFCDPKYTGGADVDCTKPQLGPSGYVQRMKERVHLHRTCNGACAELARVGMGCMAHSIQR